MWDVRDTPHHAYLGFKKTKIICFVFDVYLNILHLSYKTYAENTMFIFEPAGLGGYCIPIFQLNVSCGLATFR